MKIYKTNGVQRIREQLRQQIVNDNLIPGDQLLPERALSKKYKVSRTMIRSILDELEEEKIIERKQGNGTFVTGAVSKVSISLPDSKRMKFSSERYFSFSPSVKTKLKFYTMDYHPLQKKIWSKIISDFSSVEPGIEILPVFGDEVSPDNLAEKISGYDVVQLAPFQSGMIPDSKLLNLKPLVEKNKFNLDEFLDLALKPCMKDGFIRALPFTLSFSGILVINKELTQKAKTGIPDAFSNLEHFFKWCSELTSSLNENASYDKVWGTNLQNFSYYVLSEMARGFFIKGKIDVSALEKYLRLILQYRGKSYSSAYASEELYDQFLKGDIAVFPGNTLDLLCLNDEAKFPWTIRPMPKVNSEKYYAVLLENCMPANTHYKEEAWAFIKYLSSERAQLVVAENHACSPVLEEAAFSNTYLTRDKFHRQTLLEMLRNAEEIKNIKPSDLVRVPRTNVNVLWRKLFKDNRTNDEILCGIVNLANEVNRNLTV